MDLTEAWYACWFITLIHFIIVLKLISTSMNLIWRSPFIFRKEIWHILMLSLCSYRNSKALKYLPMNNTNTPRHTVASRKKLMCKLMKVILNKELIANHVVVLRILQRGEKTLVYNYLAFSSSCEGFMRRWTRVWSEMPSWGVFELVLHLSCNRLNPA